MTHPIGILNKWLQEEHERGAPNPFQGVLSTATQEAVPHARVVAIREISEEYLLFFSIGKMGWAPCSFHIVKEWYGNGVLNK